VCFCMFYCFCGACRVIVPVCAGSFVACCVHRLSDAICWWLLPGFLGGGWVGGVGLVVCVTSCEGHMVDALASRADEGRRSLR
jgi:hypothetical protein